MPQRSPPTSTIRTTPAGSPLAVAARGTPAAGSNGAPWATDSRLQAAVELVASGEHSVLSLEPFGALMWRKVPEPTSAPYLLGARLDADGLLAPDVDGGDFAVIRARAEAEVQQAGAAGVTLGEICARIPPEALSGITLAELVDREVEFERTILVPDLDVVELARWAAEQGMRIVCVSNTYFSEAHVRSFLGAAPVAALKVERVFTSSTRGLGKADALWRAVCEELGIDAHELVHLAADSTTDAAAPVADGVRTVCLERRPPTLSRIMHSEDEHVPAPLSPYHGDYGVAALRSKVLHRVECAEQPRELRPHWVFGAASLGPPLTGFAEWVQQRASRAGVSRVFCMMRSGRLLAEMVNAAASSVSAPVEADPFWLSRQLCARAAIVDGTAAELRTVLRRSTTTTMGEYCATLGVDIGDVDGFEGSAEAPLSDPIRARALVEQLARESALTERIVAGAAELRARIVRYLERMRPEGEDRLVLVDLGRGAPTQSLLDALLRASRSNLRTTGLYLIATDRAAERMPDGADVHGFLAYAGQPPRPVDALIRAPEILEQICVSADDALIGLDHELEPVFRAVKDAPAQTTPRLAEQRGIASFQREWVHYRTSVPGALVPLHEYGQERLRSVLVRALSFPTADEAGLFAGPPGDESPGGSRVEPPVPAAARRYLEPGELLENQLTELHWPFDLAALYDEQLATAVNASAGKSVPWRYISAPSKTDELEIHRDRPCSRAGDVIRTVRIDLAQPPCSLRLEWIRLRGLAERLALRGIRPRGRLALVVSGTDEAAVAELRRLVRDDAPTVRVRRGFAALPLPPPRLRRRAAAAWSGVRGIRRRSR